MKKFLILFATLFCTVAFADTETINWYMDDGNTYATTTCQTGSDIVLPTSPYRRGFTFNGWREVANRGIYPDWSSVPTDVNQYVADNYNAKTPRYGDYIIVTDAIDYPPLNFKFTWLGQTARQVKIEINGETTVYGEYGNINNYPFLNIGPYGCLSLMGNTGQLVFNKRVGSNEPGATMWISLVTYSFDFLYEGTWKFVYEGDWDSDGINGWKAKEMVNQ